MLNELLKSYQEDELNVFEVLQHVTDVEYRLDRHGEYKNVLLNFGGEMLCTENARDPCMDAINEVYRMKYKYIKGV